MKDHFDGKDVDLIRQAAAALLRDDIHTAKALIDTALSQPPFDQAKKYEAAMILKRRDAPPLISGTRH